ncbi:MAG TPA: hypothetical protein P5567_12835 [Kiritimatiellia bacterium]|nr:hypothetical protein [Kiritimatiellia bacterium]HRZ13327.1 hypothetical protein [Kiritimatiellia bacterium]HSA18776.1 hypothetical protein [Kiritimatiellia bacterium]
MYFYQHKMRDVGCCLFLLALTSLVSQGDVINQYGATGNMGGVFNQWPSVWTPILSLNDGDNAKTECLDFVGDNSNPGAYMANENGYLFFRMRVDEGTITSGTYADNIWIYIDRLGYNYGGNADGQPDYALAWDTQKSHGLEFQTWSANGNSWNIEAMNDIDATPGSKSCSPRYQHKRRRFCAVG